jgi:SPP1 gp7 family putative phage head morphogenesis protein
VVAAEPVLPPQSANPIGGTVLIRRARVETDRAIRDIQNWLLGAVSAIPTTRIEINTSRAPFLVNQTKYEYLISLPVLQQIVDGIKQRFAQPAVSEPVVSRAVVAYEIGTAAAVTNFAAITAGEITRQIGQVLASDPWQRRVALVRARVFEQMQGFAAETATDLGRVLMQGIENGQNPLMVARSVRDSFDVSRSRAERIARTELTGALRRARLDESDQLSAEVGIRTKILWLSALSPTTRSSHAARHANLYESQEVREFYSRDGNAINCRCGLTNVVVDSEGKPIVDRAIPRAKAVKAKYMAAQG